MNKSFVLSTVLVAILFFIPAITIAHGLGFVTCNGTDCSACHLADLANILIKWLFGIFFLVFAGLMTIAGFGLVTSGGNQSALEAAKSKFTNAIIGLIIMMAAWLIVDTIMRGLMKTGDGSIDGWGPWSEVKCMRQTNVAQWSRTGSDTIDPGIITPPAAPSGSASHDAAVAKLGNEFTISSSGNCSDRTRKECTSLDGIREKTLDRIMELQDKVGINLTITGGTEAGHAAGPHSHANGYKIDLRPEPRLNNYIEANFTKVSGSKWKDSNGNIYYRHEPDHWDITITN